jgi:endoglucanase
VKDNLIFENMYFKMFLLPGCITTIRLPLRRTLVRLIRYAAMTVSVTIAQNAHRLKKFSFFLLSSTVPLFVLSQSQPVKLSINDSGYFETRGLNVFVFNNLYGLFGDEKASGIEIIHHGVRTATNGDVRLNPTPEQWDSIPQLIKKEIKKESNSIEVFLKYPSFDFEYSIQAESKDNGISLRVNLSKPLPVKLEGVAGLNLEFLPAAYFHKSYSMDGRLETIPLYPSSDMIKEHIATEPLPLATGKTLVLAPEDDSRRIKIQSNQELKFYDGRNKAQNGWYVVRTLIPSRKTGKVIEWFIFANTIPGWVREPMIAYSQVGYHPSQKKIAVIELDKNDHPLSEARLLKVSSDGKIVEQFKSDIKRWGNYLRYDYFTFDFSAVREPGLYEIQYGKQQTQTFRISQDVFDKCWQQTLDVYFPVAMDHMFVKEAYRVWHGASHLDDALQAPVNHVHFDLYAQGSSTGTPFQPGEHIPGLNMGGWYDAGDFDLRTQTIYAVVLTMAHTWEDFKLTRDETYIDEKTRHVSIHVPDGKPDLLQQIEHGTLFLLSQFRSVGHAINGVIEAHLSQYTHLGDASTKTDNLIYNAKLDSLQSDGFTSGTFDDRWAFTTKSSALNYGSIAALAAASRTMKNYNDTLAKECLATAIRIWKEEQSHPPDIFVHGNTTGGPLLDEELKAALELLITTRDTIYASKLNELLPFNEKQFGRYAILAVRAMPYLTNSSKQNVESLTRNYKTQLDQLYKENAFGVPITRGGWAGSAQVVGSAITNYYLHQAFPTIIDKESVYRGLNYIYGCHPGSNISLVSGVGTRSKEVAYGNNRADFSFIAGGVVPGVLILKPDFPENKEDWPFMWGENEYVVALGASYIFLVNAAIELLNEGN